MRSPRPIVLIDGNPGEIQRFNMALSILNVDAPAFCFNAPQEAMDFLRNTDTPPALLLCDLEQLQVSGQDLRRTLSHSPELHALSLPVIILSASAGLPELTTAFSLPVQGFFRKESSFDKYLDQLERILKYWSIALSPAWPEPTAPWK